MDIPAEQTAPFARQRSKKTQLSQTTSSLAQHHHQDRGDTDDADADDAALPTYCRFNDLRSAKICTSWIQLARLIEKQSFPPGILLSSNTRVWAVSEIRAWLASRPVADTATKEDA